MPINIDRIQNIIDINATDGDTLLFKGTSYSHLYLLINKSLNIISEVGTKITGCPQNPNEQKAIFVINEGGSGTNISGFNITSTPENSTAIFITNSSNVTIKNNTITGNGTGVKVNTSTNVTVNNNTITNSKTGINITDSNNTKIINNTITGNEEGIRFSGNTSNSEISKNNISKNKEYGIMFEGPEINTHRNVKINYNYINDNEHNSGIYINSSYPNMNISSNMITNNGRHGICMDYGANKTGNPIIEYNYILGNKGFNDFAIQRINTSDDDRLPLTIGYNFYGTSSRSLLPLCAKTDTGIIYTKLEKISNGLYKISYLTADTNTLVKEMIAHDVKVYLNDEFKNVLVSNGAGIVDFRESNFKSSGNEVYTYYKYKESIQVKESDIPKKSINISTTINSNKIKNGATAKYTVTVKNNGDKKIKNINISKMIPNFNVYNYNVNIGTFNKKTGIWTIPLLNAGEIATLNIFIVPNKANTYKTKAVLTGDGFNIESNQLSMKVEDYVKILSTNKISAKTIKRNKSTYLISTLKNTGTLSSKYLKISIKLPKNLKLVNINYKKYFNKKTNQWKIKVPMKKTLILKMKIKGIKKSTNKITFNINGKKQTKKLRVL
ncbi:right-handed parallel beta-helix repeat-containing protein [Methanobrevibacter cuticularis]|nr:right-handed parallel beta-helix repeat-containing protein [Methanobrevibacter cuticularis]